MAAFAGCRRATRQPHRGRARPSAPRFARAFATWTAPTPLARPNAWPAPVPLAAVFQNLPLELTAKCVMGGMGLRWKHVCDKIRKHSYAIQEGQYLMPPLEYPGLSRSGPASFEGLHLHRGDAWPNDTSVDATPLIDANALLEGRATTPNSHVLENRAIIKLIGLILRHFPFFRFRRFFASARPPRCGPPRGPPRRSSPSRRGRSTATRFPETPRPRSARRAPPRGPRRRNRSRTAVSAAASPPRCAPS